LRWWRATGLQKSDSTAPVLREPGGDDRAGRPTPDHDEIERLGHVVAD
jgi:hypothetical protein